MASRLSHFFGTMLIQTSFIVPSAAYPREFYDYKLISRALEDTNAKNLKEHAEKYAIPYGVLGVVSHALTFYVILCHLFGRSPLYPLRNLKKERWNVAVVSLSSLITIILSGVTLARIRGSRPLMIMAGMQMVLSALIDFIHIHRMMLKAEGWNRPLAFWTVPLLIVSIFSVYALYEFKFTHEEGKSRNIFEAIGVLVILAWVGLTGLATAIAFIACALTGFREMVSFAICATVLSCALFWLGDAGLAMVTKNSIGTPSPQVEALYYTFWVVERLPMFTF